MAYTPTNWQTGDTITAEKMNKLENGVAAVPVEAGTGTETLVQKSAYKPNTATGDRAVALGGSCTASGAHSVAMGYLTTASAMNAFAFGGKMSSFSATQAGGAGSIALGMSTVVSANYGVGIGTANEVTGSTSVAIGRGNKTTQIRSVAIGEELIANGRGAVVGCYNEEDEATADAGGRRKYVFIVGNGTADDSRSNALAVDWNGNAELQGGITLGKGTANEVTVTPAQMKALLTMTVWQGGNY